MIYNTCILNGMIIGGVLSLIFLMLVIMTALIKPGIATWIFNIDEDAAYGVLFTVFVSISIFVLGEIAAKSILMG